MTRRPSDSARPVTGRELLGWIARQRDPGAVKARAVEIGRAHGYRGLILAWTAAAVADVWHDLVTKPARGASKWGGGAPADSANHAAYADSRAKSREEGIPGGGSG